jgi:hypothetical protein
LCKIVNMTWVCLMDDVNIRLIRSIKVYLFFIKYILSLFLTPALREGCCKFNESVCESLYLSVYRSSEADEPIFVSFFCVKDNFIPSVLSHVS